MMAPIPINRRLLTLEACSPNASTPMQEMSVLHRASTASLSTLQ
jgi:hypothetical protein